MSFLSPAASQPAANPRWRILAVGLTLVLLAAGAGLFLVRGDHAPEPIAPDPYSSRLQISSLKLSHAANLVGGEVTYVEGTVTNAGDKTVTAARVEATFRDSLNQVAQKERADLRILKPNGVYEDAVQFNSAPLAPGQSDQFQMAFEHISAQWNQSAPEIQVLRVATQ